MDQLGLPAPNEGACLRRIISPVAENFARILGCASGRGGINSEKET
jgi:hypothetical protein